MFNTTIATQIYAKICFEATNSQKKIIENLSEYLSDDDFSRIFVLNGFAGTGKTTLIAALVAALKELRIKPVLLAPTGRAAKVLARYCGEQALTIHKRIYRQRTNADYESKFSLDFNREQGAVFIVDEASMLSDSTGDGALFGSGSLLEDLVSYVRSGRGCRLILVGDSAQLPPVGCDFSPALDPATAEKVLGLTRRIVAENGLTCLMVTHNMQSALELGNRTVMMNAGKIVMDVSGEERARLGVPDLLRRFRESSGKELHNDRMLLI